MPWHDNSALEGDTQNRKVTVPVQFWDFPECPQVCGDKCLAAQAEHEKEQAGISCKVSTLWMPCGVICEKWWEPLAVTMCFRSPVTLSKADFFETT